ISEGEFSGVMKIAAQEGSLLSEVFRNAFDCEKLENTVKDGANNSSCICKNPFVSCACDTNMEDLRSVLANKPNAGNGFGNRFLYAFVQKTKSIPLGGAELKWDNEIGNPNPEGQRQGSFYQEHSLLDVLDKACNRREEVKRSWNAARLWTRLYSSFESRV